MPPVLNVPLHELMGRGSDQVLARDRALGYGQGHHILELVAESVGTTGLIEGGSGPDPAGKRLVQEPPVEHQVQGAVGRSDLNRSEDVIPLCRHGS